MELRHLRYFVAVAEELHFRRAAERLHISQPPLSQQVRALEAEIGAELLLRNRRGVELTPAGAAFLEDARRVLSSVDSAVERARRAAAGEAGELAIGFVGSTMYGRVPELLRTFRERYPEVVVHLRELTTGEQVAALVEHHIDIGFLRPPVAGPGVIIETLVEEPIVVALPHDHPLAARRTLTLEMLGGEDIVTLERSEAPGLYAAMEVELSRGGVIPRVVQVVSELQTAVGLVASGLGITFVPESVRALERPEVVYRPLADAAPTIGLGLAYRDEARAPVIDTFLRVARSVE